eukprot:7427881-Lingulodinium_polyedra.AAC.1
MSLRTQFGANYDPPSLEHVALASTFRLILAGPFLRIGSRSREVVRAFEIMGRGWHGRVGLEGVVLRRHPQGHL